MKNKVKAIIFLIALYIFLTSLVNLISLYQDFGFKFIFDNMKNNAQTFANQYSASYFLDACTFLFVSFAILILILITKK